jgi:hypothetical protein
MREPPDGKLPSIDSAPNIFEEIAREDKFSAETSDAGPAKGLFLPDGVSLSCHICVNSSISFMTLHSLLLDGLTWGRPLPWQPNLQMRFELPTATWRDMI